MGAEPGLRRHKWVPEPGLRRLAHAAALPEDMAIVDDSDMRSLGHPLFGRRFVAHDPGVVSWGTAVVSAFPATRLLRQLVRRHTKLGDGNRHDVLGGLAEFMPARCLSR